MKRRRDYQKKDFRNPYFNEKRGKKRRSLKFLLSCFFIVLFLGLYLGNTLDYFKIKNIEVRGNTTISQEGIRQIISEQLNNRRFLVFNQESLLFFSKHQARKMIIDDYLVEGVKINKNLFNTLIVEIKEKSYSVVWVIGPKKYYLDQDGIAVKEVGVDDFVIETGQERTEIIIPLSLVESYPIVYDLANGTSPAVGDKIASKDLISFITNLSEFLTNNTDFEVSGYSILGPEQISMQTTEGWQVFFRTTNSVTQQVNRLLLILKEEVKDRSDLEYIDLRFAEKVFYK